MNQAHSDALDKLVRKLNVVTRLSESEERAIRALPLIAKTFAAGQDFVHEHDQPDHCALIVRGWASRYKTTSLGRRQILSLHFPGEIPDLQSLLLSTMDHSLAALTELGVAFIPHAAVRAAIQAEPHLAIPLWRLTLIDAALYREWLMVMGRLNAVQHMGHLFCELQMRLEAVGLASRESGFDFPLTQTELGDAVGMSPVHVNRTIQDMRRLDLITWTQGRLLIHNFEDLAERSDFDPTYLHQSSGLGAF